MNDNLCPLDTSARKGLNRFTVDIACSLHQRHLRNSRTLFFKSILAGRRLFQFDNKHGSLRLNHVLSPVSQVEDDPDFVRVVAHTDLLQESMMYVHKRFANGGRNLWDVDNQAMLPKPGPVSYTHLRAHETPE